MAALTSILTGAGIGGGVGAGVGALIGAKKGAAKQAKIAAGVGVAGAALGALIGVPAIGGVLGKAIGGLFGKGKSERGSRPILYGSTYGALPKDQRKALRDKWAALDDRVIDAYGLTASRDSNATDTSLFQFATDSELNELSAAFAGNRAAAVWGQQIPIGGIPVTVAEAQAVEAVSGAIEAGAAAPSGGQAIPLGKKFPIWGYLAIAGGVVLLVILLRR